MANKPLLGTLSIRVRILWTRLSTLEKRDAGFGASIAY